MRAIVFKKSIYRCSSYHASAAIRPFCVEMLEYLANHRLTDSIQLVHGCVVTVRVLVPIGLYQQFRVPPLAPRGSDTYRRPISYVVISPDTYERKREREREREIDRERERGGRKRERER